MHEIPRHGATRGVTVRPRPHRRRPASAVRRLAALGMAICLGLLLSLAALVPLGPLSGLIPIASAHAFLLRSDPPARALLPAPPSAVRLWFSEDISPLTSRALVVDTTNRRVDNHDSHVNSGDAREMDLSLPLLRSGTYVVVWRTQSAEDGHITGGSFYFQIAQADGTAPPIPAVLPTGNVAGGAGTGASNVLDGPTWLQTVGTWLALLFMTFWVGGVIWETWILPPGGRGDDQLAAAGRLAAARFRRLAPWALGALLVADLVIVLAFSAELAGDWSGLFSPALLGAILFGSHFGTFWWMRQIVAGIALVMAVLELRGAPFAVAWRPDDGPAWRITAVGEPRTPAQWVRWSLAALRALPGAMARGWQRRTNWGRAVLVLGAALLLAFALSGHAAAVPAPELPYALSVDLLHLLGNAAWAGGLFYIAVVLVPALRQLAARDRAQVLARGLPHFSALALATVLVLSLTGSLNATIHLTSWLQFLTTAYGQTLAIKIELFLVMAAISAYHAFRLRPRLEQSLAVAETRTEPAIALATATGSQAADGSRGARDEGDDARAVSDAPGDGNDAHDAISPTAWKLSSALEDWLQREAAVGAAILVCVALLAAFAGTLAPAPPTASGAVHVPYVSPAQVANGLNVTLKVDPDAFGTNTFTLTVRDSSGKPVNGAGVEFISQMLDMDMGVQTAQFKPTGAPGAYSLQSDLTMAGHWRVTIRVLAPGSQTYQNFIFEFTATY
jgi:methionine-rich copper-binding protein CopC/uncharacterized membrane protein